MAAVVGIIIYWSVHPSVASFKGGAKRWVSYFAFPLQAFGGTDLILVGGEKVAHGYNINFKQVDSLEEALKEYPKAKKVALVGRHPEEIKPVKLKDYKHPKGNTLYIIGPDYGDVEFEKLKRHKVDYVNIETKDNISHLWSHNCAAIVLRDRKIKWR